MQIGVIGLGRMGGNIVRRLAKAGHSSVVYDANPAPGAALAKEGATAVTSLQSLVETLQAPRTVWVMLPAGKITEETIATLASLMKPGDTIIDGGNTNFKDDVRRARDLKPKGLHYLDVGTSGGVWGLQRGYCLMIGGDTETVQRLDPIFAALAPGLGDIERTSERQGGGREALDPRAERGYIHAGPAGAGHFVKMIHNGIEYGMMQAFAEGFDIMKHRASDKLPADERFDLNLADIAEVWRRGSVGDVLAARSHGGGARQGRPARALLRQRRGFGRRPLDDRGRDRGSRAGRRAGRVAVRALPLAPATYVCGKGSVGHAARLRRPRRAP